MPVMIEVTNPLAREQTMTKTEDRSKIVGIKELLERDEDFVRSAVQSFVQAALEAEMTEALSAEKGERTEGRLGYRSGYYSRALITRVGTLELRVPQDRAGRFSTELFERYQRSEKASRHIDDPLVYRSCRRRLRLHIQSALNRTGNSWRHRIARLSYRRPRDKRLV